MTAGQIAPRALHYGAISLSIKMPNQEADLLVLHINLVGIIKSSSEYLINSPLSFVLRLCILIHRNKSYCICVYSKGTQNKHNKLFFLLSQ